MTSIHAINKFTILGIVEGSKDMPLLTVFVIGFGLGSLVSHVVFMLTVFRIREWVKSLPDDDSLQVQNKLTVEDYGEMGRLFVLFFHAYQTDDTIDIVDVNAAYQLIATIAEKDMMNTLAAIHQKYDRNSEV
jgi:hypothetical protein